MINLLPKENKKELHAARQNSFLLRYCILVFIVLILVALIFSGTYFIFKSTEMNSENIAQSNKNQASNLNKTKMEANDYQKNIMVAKKIFDSDISYSTILLKIAKITPDNTNLESLNLSPEMTKQPTSLNIKANTYEDVIKLKNEYQTADFVDQVILANVQDNSDPQQNDDFPISATVYIKFNDKILEKESKKND